MADPKRGSGLTVAVMHGGLSPVKGLHEPPEPEPDADDQGDQDQDDTGVNWDDALGYHGQDEVCSGCTWMPHDPAAPCPVVKHPVDAGGHCRAYSPAEENQEVPGPEAAGGPPAGNQQ